MNSLARYPYVSGLQQESEESLLARQLWMKWKRTTLLCSFRQVCIVSRLLSATFFGLWCLSTLMFSSWILKLVASPVSPVLPLFVVLSFWSCMAVLWTFSEVFPISWQFLGSQPEPRWGCRGMSEPQQDCPPRERSQSKNVKHWGHILWDIKWGT